MKKSLYVELYIPHIPFLYNFLFVCFDLCSLLFVSWKMQETYNVSLNNHMVMMCVGCQRLKSPSSLSTLKECDGEENPLQDKQL